MRHTAWFEQGVLYLAPDPVAPFVALTHRLSDAYGVLPFDGRYPEVIPHLTIAQYGPKDALSRIDAIVILLAPRLAALASAVRCHTVVIPSSTATTDSGYTARKEEPGLDQSAFEHVAVSFAAFHAEFAPLFGRKEAQRRSEQYLRGLLVQQTDRRNAENVAETIVGAPPRALQRLLTEVPWPTGPVIARLQAAIGARLNEPAGVFVIDESGFPKQGKYSVGVARRYCGTLGKVGNCQLGVTRSSRSPDCRSAG